MSDESPKYARPSAQYEGADLVALGAGCMRLSFELRLLEKPQRSQEERQAMAAEIASALFYAARAITPHVHAPASPEKALQGASETLYDAFGGWYAHQVRTARWHAIRRASEFVLGAGAE